MRTTDWQYDFSSLSGWGLREKRWDVYDEFFELKQSELLCCIYSVAEVRMMNYLGRLAILRNKENPQLILNIPDVAFCPSVSASADGNILFLQPQVYDTATGRIAAPILILDIPGNRFTYVRTDNGNPCYKILQCSETVFAVNADEDQRKYDKRLNALHGKKIRLNWLKWQGMEQINNLKQILW